MRSLSDFNFQEVNFKLFNTYLDRYACLYKIMQLPWTPVNAREPLVIREKSVFGTRNSE